MTNSPADREGVLVIGYGNPLRGDDGTGPRVARLLQERGFTTLALHQLTPELAEPIAAARTVFFLDADARLTGGNISIERIDPGGQAGGQPVEHYGSPATLLSLARDVYGASPIAWRVGLGGENWELGDDLSAAAEQSIGKALSEILSRAREPA